MYKITEVSYGFEIFYNGELIYTIEKFSEKRFDDLEAEWKKLIERLNEEIESARRV